MLRRTVSLTVCLDIKHSSGAQNKIFITVRQLGVCWCGAPSLTRRRVCRLQLLLVLASAVILGSGYRGTRDHILLSQIRDFPFRRLLRVAGLRWKYSTNQVKVTLRLTVGQSVSKSWCRALSGAHGQILITLWQLRSCFVGRPLWREDGSVFCIFDPASTRAEHSRAEAYCR
jgi:hypothetical protein